MSSAFETQLDSQFKLTALPALPLTHLTDWAGFAAIFSSRSFQAKTPCPVYQEFLFYAFYGRVAYRLKGSESAHFVPTYSPVCFLLKPELIDKAKRVLPFDSGGFARYAAAMHSSLTKENFELSVSQNSAMRVIAGFWETNFNYWNYHLKPDVSINPLATALFHYHQLIANKLSVGIDERSSTVEIQFPQPMTLQNNILALIAPSNVVNDDLGRFATELGAELITYKFRYPYYVAELHTRVSDCVEQFLTDKGYL